MDPIRIRAGHILFGTAMDKTRYKETLQRSSLVYDLESLPFGDLTQIGERGVNLSGGQKQRIQLARALYYDADIYLLDDPFSSVDRHTTTSLFNVWMLKGFSVLLHNFFALSNVYFHCRNM